MHSGNSRKPWGITQDMIHTDITHIHTYMYIQYQRVRKLHYYTQSGNCIVCIHLHTLTIIYFYEIHTTIMFTQYSIHNIDDSLNK